MKLNKGLIWRWMALGCVTILLVVQRASGSVEVKPIKDCTQRPLIVVLRDSHPFADAVIEVFRQYQYPKMPQRVGQLKTNSRGEVRLPKLEGGLYSVVASWKSGSVEQPDLQAEEFMRYAPVDRGFVPADQETTDVFTLNLRPWSNEVQWIHENALAAESKPILNRAPDFSGIVVADELGSPIRHATVRIIRLRTSVPEPVQTMETDVEGHFRAIVSEGDYLAVFTAEGYEQSNLTVTIDAGASRRELPVLLQFVPPAE